MANPTIVMVTDRNDLDNQLFDTFAAGQALLRQDPAQAESRTDLKRLLDRASEGLVFTTIQKLARELSEEVKRLPKLDWTRRESVRVDLRRRVRRLLAKYGYPPDLSEDAAGAVNPLALRPREAARAIGVSERTLWSLTADQTSGIPHVRIGRAVVYPVRELTDWLRDRAAKGGR